MKQEKVKLFSGNCIDGGVEERVNEFLSTLPSNSKITHRSVTSASFGEADDFEIRIIVAIWYEI